jgi:hypothetical protein
MAQLGKEGVLIMVGRGHESFLCVIPCHVCTEMSRSICQCPGKNYIIIYSIENANSSDNYFIAKIRLSRRRTVVCFSLIRNVSIILYLCKYIFIINKNLIYF